MSVDRFEFRNRLFERPAALWRICCPKPVMALLLSMVGVWLVRRYGLRGRHYGVFFIIANPCQLVSSRKEEARPHLQRGRASRGIGSGPDRFTPSGDALKGPRHYPGCPGCRGVGTIACQFCKGTGTYRPQRLIFFQGPDENCLDCQGTGRLRCPVKGY